MLTFREAFELRKRRLQLHHREELDDLVEVVDRELVARCGPNAEPVDGGADDTVATAAIGRERQHNALSPPITTGKRVDLALAVHQRWGVHDAPVARENGVDCS